VQKILLAKDFDHKDIESRCNVIPEGPRPLKAIAQVERVSRFECRSASGLQKEIRVASPLGDTDDFIENGLSDAASQVFGVRSHRLDLAGGVAQHL
jgi:hypothetical protein